MRLYGRNVLYIDEHVNSVPNTGVLARITNSVPVF